MASQYFTNSFLGPAYALAVNSFSTPHRDGLHLQPIRNGCALPFTLVPCVEDSYRFNICTTHPHTKSPQCLDIFNDNSADRTRVRLADPGHYSGQMWTLIPQAGEGPGWYKLQNDFTGQGWYLDTYDGSYEAFMSQGDASGQYWKLTSTDNISPGQYGTPTVVEETEYTAEQGHHKTKKFVGDLAKAWIAKKAWDKVT
jgi:hypothetical protein